MARRPSTEEFDHPFSAEELAERPRRLAMLSPHVAEKYRQAHEACRMEGEQRKRPVNPSGG
jgi:hypothetical protein